MKLARWLESRKIKRKDFASSIGKSASYVTDLCEENCWPSHDVAATILAATDGEVTPTDFLRGDAGR